MVIDAHFAVHDQFSGEPIGGHSFQFIVSCPDGRVQIPGSDTCGCPRGSVLRAGVCKLCDSGKSAETGELECTRCAQVWMQMSSPRRILSLHADKQSALFPCLAGLLFAAGI